jgi:sodium/potassium-transporting ATPase subunit alpha
MKQKKFGPNQLTEKDKVHPCILFLKEQTGFFSLLLWFGSILCFIAYGIQEDKTDESNLYLGIVLGVVVFVTGVFSYSQSSKAASLMDDFKNMIPPQARVLRGGKWGDVEAKELVPGDIIEIAGGFQIPADTILFTSNEMKVNNASLTGEAEELLRKPDEIHESVYESPNVAFFGTSCTNGKGKGLVFRTGDDTAIGRIANLTDSADNKQTPLSHEIERFIILISAVAMILGISFFLYGLIIVEYGVVDMLVFAIGIIVANVPEGLLATVTVSLALTAKRMHQKMVLVKNLESVETLGSTSCICSDKTGTLTQNRMTVSHLWIGKDIINAEVNWETFKRELETENKKGKDGLPDKVKRPDYNVEDKLFRELMFTLALSTTTFFNFDPKLDEVKNWHRKDAKKAKAQEYKFPKDLASFQPAD